MEEKLSLAHEFFKKSIGTPAARHKVIDLEKLGLCKISEGSSRELEAPFSKEEIKKVLDEMPSDRAPGPDGFAGLFYKSCWDTIADNCMSAKDELHQGHV